MLNSRKYAALAVLGVGLAVAAATPAKAQWLGWGRPSFGFAGWPMAYGYAGVPRIGFRCAFPRAYAAYYPRYRFYRPRYAYAGYFPRHRFYRPSFAYAAYYPRFRFYRPRLAYAAYYPRFRFYRPAFAYAGYLPRYRFYHVARVVW
jgi:hypothetical protein